MTLYVAFAVYLAQLTCPATGTPQRDSFELLEKAIEGIGGREAISRCACMRIVGSGVEFKGDVRIEFKSESWFLRDTSTRIFTGLLPNKVTVTEVLVTHRDRAWYNSEGRVIPLSNEVVKRKRFEQHVKRVKSLVPLFDKGTFSLKRISPDRIEGAESPGIEVFSENNPSIKLYFNVDSSLLSKISFQYEADLIEEYLTDYRLVKGAKMPHSIKTFANRRLKFEETISEIELLTPKK